jgi:clan AA aspartic protease (TIGR02281 family)
MQRDHLLVSSGAAMLGLVLSLAVPGIAGDAASAKSKLAEKGIRVTHAGISLQEETEFSKAVSAAYTLKRKLSPTSKSEDSSASDDGESAAQIEALNEQSQALKQRLAQINVTGIAFRGPIEQELRQKISEIDNEIARIQQARKQASKSTTDVRHDDKAARQSYDQAVFDARKLADRVMTQYAELNKDSDVLSAIKEWNESAHTSNVLKPSHSFESAVKRLETLEKKIVSQKVPLRQEGTNYYAAVAINGEKTIDMLVDTSAPTLVLPYQVAVDAGLKVAGASETKSDQPAEESGASAKRLTLKTVRVGSFMAKNVACKVLPPNDKSDKPILGTSFLSQFKGEINATSSELSLVRADAESSGTRKHKKPAPKHPHKKTANPAPSDDSTE